MRRILFALLVCFLICIQAVSANILPLSSYSGNITFTYNIDPTMGSQTDYQVKFILSNLTGVSGTYSGENIIYTNGSTRTDWYDVNATDGSGNPLAFWLENNTYTAKNATAWVNVPTISVANTSTGRWYYGNTTQTASTMNGLNTFPIWDDFLEGLNTTKWVQSGSTITASPSAGTLQIHASSDAYQGIYTSAGYGYNYSCVGRAKQSSLTQGVTSYPVIGFGNLAGSLTSRAIYYFDNSGAPYHYMFQTRDGTTSSAEDTGISVSTNYHTFSITRNGSYSANGALDNANKITKTTNPPTISLPAVIASYSTANDIVADWIFIKKSMQYEPTISLVGAPSPGTTLVSNFTGTPLTGHAPLEVTFTDESIGTPDSWNWSFGDGDVLNGKPDILTHTYLSKGLYSVNLSVGNNTAGNSSLVKTDYINVLNASELYPSFDINAVSGYKPFVVIVNDTSTNFNATINTLEWDFVEGSTHTIDNDQNTSFTYNSTQVPKYVKLTISNSSFGIWNSTSVNITATDVSGFTQQDIWMDPQYTLTLHVTDSATGLVIPDVSLTDSSTTYLTTNGTFILTYPYSTVVLTLASTGYAGKQVSYVMDSDREETVQLSEKSASTSTTWYTPKTVQFSIVDVYGNQLTGAVVNANYNETTLPKGLSDLIDNYGMNSDSANDALNGTLIMHGSTDSQGNIVFTMLSTIKYDVNVTYGGNTNYYSVYPQDSQYQLKFIVPVTTDNIWDDLYASGNTKVWATEPDIGNVTFHWSFQDVTDLTTRIDFYLKDVDLNTTVYMTNVTSPVKGGIYQLNYTVPNERGKNYIAWENYTRSV